MQLTPRGGALLYPRERCRRYRLRVHWPLSPRGPEPCHRARGRVPEPQCRGSSCPRAKRGGKPAAEAGSRRIHPSLRLRSRLGLRAPWFSDDGRRALRRSPRRGISRQGQCDEAAVSAPCCQRPELASNGGVTVPAHPITLILIRQNGCPNCIKFRMTLNGIQNRDLSWHTREMRHGRRRTAKTGRLSSSRESKQIVKNDGKTIAEARTKITAEDVAERLNAEEHRREEDRWSA